jgi:hypothetical protein
MKKLKKECEIDLRQRWWDTVGMETPFDVRMKTLKNLRRSVDRIIMPIARAIHAQIRDVT